MGKMRASIMLVFTLVLLLISLAPNASSEQDSMRVFLFLEDKLYYLYGDSVNITASVLDTGAYTDPTDISLKVNGSTTTVPLTKTNGATGRYEATYIINQDDAPYGYVDFTLNASISPHNYDFERKVIAVQEEAPSLDFKMRFEIEPEDINLQPGDTAGITVICEDAHTKVNADSMEILVGDEKKTHDNPSVGTYTLTYTAPSVAEPTSEAIEVTAHGVYNTVERYVSTTLYVDFYNVWIHMKDINQTSAKFDVHVADLRGKSVAGAFVSISSPTSVQNTTDKNGRSYFSITYPESDLIYMNGDVSFNVRKQKFTHAFSTGGFSGTTGYPTNPGEFDVFVVSGTSKVTPGSTFERNYIAFNNTEVWAERKVYYYAVFRPYPTSFEGRVVSHGEKMTNGSGMFQVPFQAPDEEGTMEIYFEAPTDRSTSSNDNWQYKEHIDPIISISHYGGGSLDSEIQITMGEFNLGTGTQITAKRPASLMPNAEVTWELEDSDWYWVGGETMMYPAKEGDTLTGTIYAPSFLPQDKNYTFFVKFVDEEGDKHLNLVTSQPAGVVEPGEPTDDEGLDMLTLALIVIVIVVVIVLLALGLRGGARTEETGPAKTSEPPAETEEAEIEEEESEEPEEAEEKNEEEPG